MTCLSSRQLGPETGYISASSEFLTRTLDSSSLPTGQFKCDACCRIGRELMIAVCTHLNTWTAKLLEWPILHRRVEVYPQNWNKMVEV